jgi:A/G-specific adenine glycosylase
VTALTPVAFRNALQTWHKQNARHFAWRDRQGDPYGILVAELMLRKTTAGQVAGVYASFIAAYPTWDALASADLKALRHRLRPLGIADRARLLHEVATRVVNDFEGRLPADVATLTRLPGVGRYTANAVLTFAYGESVALVDRNVIRVLARVFGWSSQRQRPHLDGELWARAQSLVPRFGSRGYHFALLDFAALMCKANIPRCGECPLAGRCGYQLAATELGQHHRPPQH